MRKLGIDLGSSSCGWAIREENVIIKKGVIIFSTGMQKGKSGYYSPAKDRREARSKRRLIQARKYRKWELLKILSQNKEYVPLENNDLEIWSKYQKGIQRRFPETEEFLKWLSCDLTYEGGVKYKNPYEIRVKGVDSKLSKHEFGRALYHIIQRRGYKDIGEKDKETKTQIERRGESGFDNAISEHKIIAKALKREFLDKGKRARNEYPYRDEYEHEFEVLCKNQGYDISKKKQGEYNNNFVKSLWRAIIWQRPLRSQKGKIGKCTLEPNSPRLPISHPLFEVFRTLQYINTIKIVDEKGEKIQLPKEYREGLLKDVFLNRDKNFTFSILKTYLDKKFQQKMEYNYLNKRTSKYDSSVSGMPVCRKFIELFGFELIDEIINLYKNNADDLPKTIKGYSIHDLWHIIFNSTDASFLREFAKEKLGIVSTYKGEDKEKIELNDFADIEKIFMQGYSDLSAKAIKKIIPYLKEGYLYNEAVLLAKIPELLGDKWEEKKNVIFSSVEESSKLYNHKSDIINIVNGLINNYKGLEYDSEKKYHPKDQYSSTAYQLNGEDIEDIEKSCAKYFGEKTWQKKANKKSLLDDVQKEYQDFFKDGKRTYRSKPTHTELVSNALKNNGIELNGDLYHHSNIKNIYPKPVYSNKHNTYLLALPLIDSIKNPMFNKAMTILRKLINELIITGEIDEFTEVIIEVARELNDNNKRAAIEKYQKERRDNREKYREFIKEFNVKQNREINIEERLGDFELWTEQVFDEAIDEKKAKHRNTNRIEILREKKAINRYELWIEQKGQCMYTGKMISISQLFSSDIQMEHTIPRSLLPDNTKANQTVCFTKYNNDVKNNKIPFECPNYDTDESYGTAIKPRLVHWTKIRNKYQANYDKVKKPKGNEDEKIKNTRIQDKHYIKMHLDYWSDKINRFSSEEIKESWVRRQLVDTQMVSKYAREFLKTFFKKVNVEKGIITAEFRKIYGFQEVDEVKSRNKHTHHAIDAAILTLIPNNASRKKALLEKAYFFEEERRGKQYTTFPYSEFNAQSLIDNIEATTLIFNDTKDKIISQTYKKVRKRGVIQKDKNGKELWMKGDSIRGGLYKDTFLGKIKDVQRYEDGQAVRENGDWKYKKDKNGNNSFIFVKRISVDDAKTKLDSKGKKPIGYIIDPSIRNIVTKTRLNKVLPKDTQGNVIRKVKSITKTGKTVKKRVNYRSKNEHKNFYYAESGGIPYAVMLEKNVASKVERKMIPIHINEVAKTFKEHRKFTSNLFLDAFHPRLKEQYDNWRLLRIGQKVLVLQDENELDEVADINFQSNRLYKITRFFEDGEGGIYLKHNLEATKDDDIDKKIKDIKHLIISKYDKKFQLPDIIEDSSINDIKERRKDYEDRKYRFGGIKDFRFSRLIPYLGDAELKSILKITKKYSKQNSIIKVEGETPLMKIGILNCKLLYEDEHFEMSILGNINLTIEIKE